MRRLGRFVRQQDGTASVLPIFMLVGLLLAAGISIDTGNLWYHGEVMRATADVAAHAGAVALSRGSDVDDAVATAQDAFGFNMDAAVFSRQAQVIRGWHYDATANILSDDGVANAVSVQIRRGVADGNPLPMYLLQLFGLKDWTVATTSVVAVTPTTLCSNAEGLFAHGSLHLTGETDIGAGYCLHSQTAIDLDRRATVEDSASISLPDLTTCTGNCTDASNAAARHEANLIGRPVGEVISQLVDSFQRPMMDSPEKQAFFASRPISDELEPLREIDLNPTNLGTGSVVQISVNDFEVLREVPAGLVYVVVCDPKSLTPPILEIKGGLNGPILRNIAVVTNCALKFDDDVEVIGSLLISTFRGEMASLMAEPYAVPGDPSATCDSGAQTQILAYGDQTVPANFVTSNVALAVDGDVTVMADPNGAIGHHGFALHASGAIEILGQHNFMACDQASLPTLPDLNVIRFVLPHVPAAPPAPALHPKMPGKVPDRLPSTPDLPMASDRVVSQVTVLSADAGL